MSLFDLVRVWDVWPRLTGSQVLRDLFRQAPTHRTDKRVRRVFATRRHLFVATKHAETNTNQLYGFSTVQEEEEAVEVDNLLVPLSSPTGGEVVGVFDLKEVICVVRERGQLEIFFQENFVCQQSGFLSKGHVCSCCVHENSYYFIYCSRLHEDGSYQLFSCTYHIKGSGNSVHLGAANLLLNDCPEVDLYPWREGVLVLPKKAPPGLLLLWLPNKPSQLQPFIIGESSTLPLNLSSEFSKLCLQLVPLWKKVGGSNERQLVSVTVGTTVEEVLILLSSGDVVTLCVHDGGIKEHTVTSLKDFSTHYPQPRPLSGDLELFSFHNYCGVFYKGDLRLYEVFSGEMVWECGDHDGHLINLLAPPYSPYWIGLYGDSGVWILRSQRLSEHIQLLSQALFPITTNADETTPGDYLEDGQALSAILCWLWNLPLPATRTALEALHTVIKRDRDSGVSVTDKFVPRLSQKLQFILDRVSLQSPALLVALLAEHPQHRGYISRSIEKYLETVPDDSITHMTRDIAPLMREYQSLCLEYEEKMSGKPSEPLLQSVSSLTTTSLQRLENGQDINLTGVRAQLQMLSFFSPSATLAGLRQFFSVTNFTSAVEDIDRGEWLSNRDWKSIFGVEVGSEVEKKDIDPITPNVPVFEITCRLLYKETPSELVSFVKFAQLARDHQAQGDSSFARKCRKNYFFQRAVQCLPVFVSNVTTPTSREALLAHSILLVNSEVNGSEGTALELLLRGQLWDDALSFVASQIDPPPHVQCTLFQSLLATMNQEGVLHCYIDRVWKLLPQNFSVFDLLNILARSSGNSYTPLVSQQNSLTVKDIGSRLLDLLPRTPSQT